MGCAAELWDLLVLYGGDPSPWGGIRHITSGEAVRHWAARVGGLQKCSRRGDTPFPLRQHSRGLGDPGPAGPRPAQKWSQRPAEATSTDTVGDTWAGRGTPWRESRHSGWGPYRGARAARSLVERGPCLPSSALQSLTKRHLGTFAHAPCFPAADSPTRSARPSVAAPLQSKPTVSGPWGACFYLA